MIKRILVFTAVFLLVCVAFGQQQPRILKSNIIEQRNGKQYYVHTVQKGQTVYSISKVYEVSPEELYFENPEAKQSIRINQQLWIPTINKETEVTEEIAETDFEFFYHIAAPNETYSHIASIYIIPEGKIRRANPGLFDPLREGEYVKVPVDIPESEVLPPVPLPEYEKPVARQRVPRANRETVAFNPNIPVIADYRHVVIAGETTKSIADKYKVPVEQLKAVNPGLSNSVVKGDRLRIPVVENTEKTKTESQPTMVAPVLPDTSDSSKTEIRKEDVSQEQAALVRHMVKKKETLYSISRQYGVKVQDLYDANPGLSDRLSIGQVIKVPKKKISSPFLLHKVSKKTKLSKLAKLYAISYYELADANPSLGKRIYPGQIVKIPVGDRAIIVPFEPEEIKVEDPVEEEIVIIPVTNECAPVQPDFSRQFKVALMVPLYFEEMDSLDVEQFLMSKQDKFLPFKYLHFYEGAMLAIDSLKHQGMQLEWYVYDVDQSITKTARVLNNPELRSMDLIIGPFYNKSFQQTALFAANFNIPIVNPLSFRETVVDKYKSVIKVKPNPLYQHRIIAERIREQYSDHKVFMITQTPYKDADRALMLENEIREVLEPTTYFSNDDLYNLAIDVAYRDEEYDASTPLPPFTFEGAHMLPEQLESGTFDSTAFTNDLLRINYIVDSLHPFMQKASVMRKNLVIIYGDNKAFVMDAMNRLNEYRDTFNIEVVGLPTWERFGNLDLTQSKNLALTYFASSHIDYNHMEVQQYIADFVNTYGVEPDAYGFAGFDITYYFLNALFHLSDRFIPCLHQLPPLRLLENTYQFQPSRKVDNFENTQWNLLQFNGFHKRNIPMQRPNP